MSERLLGGRYRLEDQIGAGGMAQVHRGTDTVLGRPVAIKVLSPHFARDAEFVARFRREAQAAARLNHPNVVGVYDTGSDDGTHYIVMEYVEGRTLADFLARGGNLPPSQAIELAEAVSKALAVAHSQGVIHRDVKPGNIMVTRRGEVKVMDFGIARFADGAETIAQTAAVLGTASYLSPEQAKGEPVDERSDIYSLGVVLYEMLTGRPPFAGESPVAVAYKHVNEAPAPPSKLEPAVSPELEAVVMRSLAKNPANRYQSADDLAKDLERLRLGQPVQATPLLPDQPTTELRRQAGPPTAVLPPGEEEEGRGRGKRILVAVLATLAILALLGAGLYVLLRALLGEERAGAQVRVPRVIGFSEQEAISTIENAELRVGDVEQTFSPEDPGTVVRQEPDPSTLVNEGAEVDLFVSRGPRPVEVPDVRGLSVEDAQEVLEAEGLVLGTQTPQETTEADPGTILSQTPEPGTKVERDTPVDVVVAQAPAAANVPDVICESLGHAESELRKAGFEVTYAETPEFNPECPREGVVARTAPGPGESAPFGSTVTIVESTPLPSSPSPEEGD